MDRYNRYPRRSMNAFDRKCASDSSVKRNCAENESDAGCGKQPSMADNCCLCSRQSVSYAMAYVKEQRFEKLYSPAAALRNGTLFQVLDMPYCAGGKRR